MRQVVPRNVCAIIRRACLTTKPGYSRIAAGMWRTFIQRSARHRRYSISSASRCALRVTADVPSYSSTRVLTISPRSRKSLRHRRARIRRRVLDVRPVHVLAARRPGWRRWPLRVSSGFPTMSPPTTNMPWRCSTSIAAIVVFCRAASLPRRRVLGRRLQKREVVFEDVLDAEEHVAEAGPAHQRRQRLAVLRDRRPSSPARGSGCRRGRRRRWRGTAPRSAARRS